MAAAALGAVAFELWSEPAPEPADLAARPTLAEQTVFCPPPPSGTEGDDRLSMTTSSRTEVPVRVEPSPGTSPPARPAERLTLSPDRLAIVRAAPGVPSVSASGGAVAAHFLATVETPTPGGVAAPCSDVASNRWYFAAGSSELGVEDRLVISNPFLDEAVVKIVFYNSRGPKAKSGLTDVAVPAGRSLELSPNDFVLRQPLLASEVTAKRGRVVVWKLELRRNSGAVLALGARRPAESWFLPDGALGEGYDERIAILNPSDREAVVTITLATDDRVIQPPKLVELSLPPATARAIALSSAAPAPPEPLGVGAAVRSVNGVGIVVERTVRYSAGDQDGIAAEVGVTGGARRWYLGPAALHPARDAVVVLNPGRRDARLDARLLRPGLPPLVRPALEGVEVPAGLAVRIPLQHLTRGRPMGVVIVSTAPVVAERSAYSEAGSDAVASMGLPVTAPQPVPTP